LIAGKIHKELQSMASLRQKNQTLQEKHKESLKEIIKLKKNNDESSLINKGLDAKLSTALAKAEQIGAFQIEKRGLEDQLKSHTK